MLITKLDIDCVRGILLAVEENDFGKCFTVESLRVKLEIFSEDEIHYCCLKLSEGGLLEVIPVTLARQNYPGIKSINGLTFYGHEFLENIREKNNFDRVKIYSKQMGSLSLEFIQEVAKNILFEKIIQ